MAALGLDCALLLVVCVYCQLKVSQMYHKVYLQHLERREHWRWCECAPSLNTKETGHQHSIRTGDWCFVVGRGSMWGFHHWILALGQAL